MPGLPSPVLALVGHKKGPNRWVGARYYDPTTGCFTQPVPSGQEANAYLYEGSNPINNTDRTGLSFWNDFVGGAAPEILGGVVGAFGGILAFGISRTPAGAAASAAVGCLAGVTGSVVGNELSNDANTAGSLAGSCAGGVVAGLTGFGASKLLNANKLD